MAKVEDLAVIRMANDRSDSTATMRSDESPGKGSVRFGELAPSRIRVNTVSPGSILFAGGGWDRFRDRDPERFAEFERREFPWGRLGTAEEVADVVAFVLSDCASWINGANIAVDGAQGRPTAF
jgi:NAD(P)-dependent dehydrogenase (short-subunit alcohol dehydrogenase family)